MQAVRAVTTPNDDALLQWNRIDITYSLNIIADYLPDVTFLPP